MKVYVEKKPIVVKVKSKDELLHKIRSNFGVLCHSMSYCGNGLHTLVRDGGTYVMYNSQKFRRKRGVRKGYWVAYVHKFDEAFLRSAKLYVEQGSRTFTIKNKE